MEVRKKEPYLTPSTDVLYLKYENLICLSDGEGEGGMDDFIVEPPLEW